MKIVHKTQLDKQYLIREFEHIMLKLNNKINKNGFNEQVKALISDDKGSRATKNFIYYLIREEELQNREWNITTTTEGIMYRKNLFKLRRKNIALK